MWHSLCMRVCVRALRTNERSYMDYSVSTTYIRLSSLLFVNEMKFLISSIHEFNYINFNKNIVAHRCRSSRICRNAVHTTVTLMPSSCAAVRQCARAMAARPPTESFMHSYCHRLQCTGYTQHLCLSRYCFERDLRYAHTHALSRVRRTHTQTVRYLAEVMLFAARILYLLPTKAVDSTCGIGCLAKEILWYSNDTFNHLSVHWMTRKESP